MSFKPIKTTEQLVLTRTAIEKLKVAQEIMVDHNGYQDSMLTYTIAELESIVQKYLSEGKT